MKIKRKSFLNFICVMIIFTSLLSYEKKLYNYYSYFQVIILGMIFFLFATIIKYERDLMPIVFSRIKKNTVVLTMFFLMILNTIISNFNNMSNFMNIFNVIGMFFSSIVLYIIIPVLDKKYKNIKQNILNIYNIFCFILIIIGLIIVINKNFFGYTLIYNRAASIYYDSNFLAMVLAINIIILFFNKKMNIFLKIIGLILSFLLIILTGSRGTLIGLVISFIVYVFAFSNMKIGKKIIIGIISLYITYLLLNYLNSVNFFRLYQGSNGRFEMIKYALEMTNKSPVFGYGYSNISKYLKIAGFKNASTHNSFIDFVFAFGIIPTIMYICFVAKNFIIGIKNKHNPELIVALTFMLFNMNTILYNFGGVGISSMIFTLILGFINIDYKEDKIEN